MLVSKEVQFLHGGRAIQAGVSLIEVLVAIVIASIGLLALAGVNASSIRYTKMSQYRGTAALLANDIGERMRANVAGGVNYALAADFATQAAAPAVPAPRCHYIPVVNPNPFLINCTAAQIAADDMYSWRERVKAQLPEGSAFIVFQNAQNAADIWVAWRDPNVAADDLEATAIECPAGLTVGGDKSVRCSYFRFNL
jgi:type IV pilus assembly protein PilV